MSAKLEFVKESGILTPTQLDLIIQLKDVCAKIENVEWDANICENDLADSVEEFLVQVRAYVGAEMIG